jgi:hypothetical protein
LQFREGIATTGPENGHIPQVAGQNVGAVETSIFDKMKSTKRDQPRHTRGERIIVAPSNSNHSGSKFIATPLMQ